MRLAHFISKPNSKSGFLIASPAGLARGAAAVLVLLFLQLAAPTGALAVTKAATVTSLAISAGGKPVTADTQLPAGTVFTLTATVTAGGNAAGPGQVNFCDARAKYCTDVHLLATVQLTKAGTATWKFRPGRGNPSYKAVFLGTNKLAGSSSGAASFYVTGNGAPLATATTIADTGSWGSYKILAAVREIGSTTPIAGKVSFLDTSNHNAVLSAATLGSSVAGNAWLTQSPLGVSHASTSVAIGDFNGDGIGDVAVAGGAPEAPILIFLGSADGTYTGATPTSFFDYIDSTPILVADFNGDGNQDLAVLDTDIGAVVILLGNGDGTFNVAASTPAIKSGAFNMVAGDFNGDGIPDLVVVGNGPTSMAILLGKGDGTFAEETSSLAVGNSPKWMTAGDFNGDGKLDLAISDAYDDTVTVLLGKGNGAFEAGSVLHSGSGGSPIVAADFTGDGNLDLAVAVQGTNGAGDSVTILPGHGDGTFGSPSNGQMVDSQSISALLVGDFNADGIPDLVVGNSQSGTFTVLTGNGKGAFSAMAETLRGGTLNQLALAVGDLEGNGRTDLAAAYDSSALVYLSEPTQTASATAGISLPATGQHLVDASFAGSKSYTPGVSDAVSLWGAQPATKTTLKLTANGAAVTSVTPGTVITLTATVTADGKPVTAGQVRFCNAAADYCTDIQLLGTASVTGDGKAAIAFVPGPGAQSYKAEFIENGFGKGSASNIESLAVKPVPPAVYSNTTTISNGGFSDGYTLTATVEGLGGDAAPTGNVSFVDTSFGDKQLATATLGTATAGIGWHISQTPRLSQPPVSEVAGDFNGDGIPDLALLWSTNDNSGPFSVTVFFGKGDGTFKTGPTTAATGVQSQPSMIIGDFNGDGRLDLAILSMSTDDSENFVTVLPGDGNGHFATPITTVAFDQPNQGGDVIAGSLVAADFNGDGKLDVAVVGDNVNAGGVTILLGNGDGSFKATADLDASQGYGLIATGDFNGDGIADLVATYYFEPGTAVAYLGKGDGTFTSGQQLAINSFPSSIVVGDFNGDGKLDLAFGNGDIDEVAVLLGKGDGTFTQAPDSPYQAAGQSLVAGDFNHDGKLDLAGIDNYALQIDLFEGVGDGTFKEIVTTPNVSQDFLGPFQIVAADFNKDGIPDLAMLTKNQNTSSILLTEPTETASATVTGVAPIGAGTHNVEAVYAGDSHYHRSVSSPVQLAAILLPPVITPAAGTYTTQQKIAITEPTPGATIYYQAFGTVNTNGYVEYTGPFFLPYGGDETISAYATEAGYQQSSYASATYFLSLPAAPKPTFSPAGGSYNGPQTVTITDTAPDAKIYYTTNGSVPSVYSTLYAGPIAVSISELVAAVAIAPGYLQSGAATAQYQIGSSQTRFIYTIAGTQAAGDSGDGGPATFASLEGPFTIARDASGNLYIGDGATVRKVAAGTGIIGTVAGNGHYGYTGDGGKATGAQIDSVAGLATDAAGNLYIADDAECVVRKVTASTGVIATIAGNGTCKNAGDGGAAVKASLDYPVGLAVDKAGNLYIGVEGYIRKVAPNGAITVFAGAGFTGYSGDNGPALNAELGLPEEIVFDEAGNLFFADGWENVVRKIAAVTSTITTAAGSGPQGRRSPGNGDGGPATQATLAYPEGLAVDNAGDLFIADTENNAIREVTASSKIINTIAGSMDNCDLLGGDGSLALDAGLCYPAGLAIDPAGNLYLADGFYARVREITALTGPPTAATAPPVLSLAEGTYPAAQTLTVTASPGAEVYITLDGSTPITSGEGYYAPITVAGPVTVNAIALEPGHLPSSMVTAAYNVTAPAAATIGTIAGSGTFGGAPGPALNANLGYLYDVASDSAGNLYIADPENGVVWKLTAATQTITAFAGTPGFSGTYHGEGGLATQATLGEPQFLALDAAGDVFISDLENERILKVSAKAGNISTYAGGGQPNSYPSYGDGGLATSAFLQSAEGIAFDKSGNLYIADDGVDRIRMVNATTGIITSVVGTTGAASLGDGGPATKALLGGPVSIAFDGFSNLYIADRGNARIRMVAAKTQIITTVAGNGIFGSGGDGESATNATIGPWGIAVSASGTIYFSNVDNTVREFVPGGKIGTIAGTGYYGFSGDGGPARMGELCGGAGIATDKTGDLLIADGCNYRLRKVTFSSAPAAPEF